jgi:hypothetical protein
MDALLALDDLIDPDLGGSIAEGRVDITMTVEADSGRPGPRPAGTGQSRNDAVSSGEHSAPGATAHRLTVARAEPTPG